MNDDMDVSHVLQSVKDAALTVTALGTAGAMIAKSMSSLLQKKTFLSETS